MHASSHTFKRMPATAHGPVFIRMCKAGIPKSSGQAYIPATQCHMSMLYIINVHATIIIFTVLLGAAIYRTLHQQELTAGHYFKGRGHVRRVSSACDQLKSQCFGRQGICHRSSKIMHTLCLLAVAICLLPEPIGSQSLPFYRPTVTLTFPYPFYPNWLRTLNTYGYQPSEGWYWVRDPTTDCAKKMYLYPNGHRTCGEGVWMRIGFFNMAQTLSQCPAPLQMFVEDGRKYCRRASLGCTSVYFDSLHQQYSEVCGMVEAYQYGHTDAFAPSSTSIDGTHLDGISITHKSPRQHLWSYVVGNEAVPTSQSNSNCPCTAQGTSATVPSFIGSDYYCSSGNDGVGGPPYPSPLWRTNGPSCVSGSTCCDNPDQPWFKKKLTQPTNEDVEMRWCAANLPTNEATATTRVELYIRVY